MRFYDNRDAFSKIKDELNESKTKEDLAKVKLHIRQNLNLLDEKQLKEAIKLYNIKGGRESFKEELSMLNKKYVYLVENYSFTNKDSAIKFAKDNHKAKVIEKLCFDPDGDNIDECDSRVIWESDDYDDEDEVVYNDFGDEVYDEYMDDGEDIEDYIEGEPFETPKLVSIDVFDDGEWVMEFDNVEEYDNWWNNYVDPEDAWHYSVVFNTEEGNGGDDVEDGDIEESYDLSTLETIKGEDGDEYFLFNSYDDAYDYLKNYAKEEGYTNYDIVEDNYEIDNGLMFIAYDEDGEEIEHYPLVAYRDNSTNESLKEDVNEKENIKGGKLKDALTFVGDGFDISDTIFDWGEYFDSYEDLQDSGAYSKVMKLFADNIDFVKYNKDWYSPCRVAEYIEKNIDKFNQFLNVVYKPEYQPQNFEKQYTIDDEEFYDIYMDMMSNLLRGNFSDEDYQTLLDIFNGKKINENDLRKKQSPSNKKQVKESRQLEESPAGFSIDLSFKMFDFKVHNIKSVKFDGNFDNPYGGNCTAQGDIKCNINDLVSESYYYGNYIAPKCDIPAKITEIKFALLDYYGNVDEEIIKELKDAEDDYDRCIIIKNYLQDNIDNLEGVKFEEGRYVNVDGEYVKVTDGLNGQFLSLTFKFKNPIIMKAIEDAATGDDIITTYEVFDEDWEPLESFNNEDEAIEWAKNNNGHYVEVVADQLQLYITDNGEYEWDYNDAYCCEPELVWEREDDEIDESLNPEVLKKNVQELKQELESWKVDTSHFFQISSNTTYKDDDGQIKDKKDIKPEYRKQFDDTIKSSLFTSSKKQKCRGYFEGVEENSWLIWGISTEDAKKLGLGLLQDEIIEVTIDGDSLNAIRYGHGREHDYKEYDKLNDSNEVTISHDSADFGKYKDLGCTEIGKDFLYSFNLYGGDDRFNSEESQPIEHTYKEDSKRGENK